VTRKIYKIEGIVVDKRERGEKDIIFTILTPEEGKIDVLAKYAKKVPSRHNSGLELFNGVQCQLYEGRFLPIVTQSKQIFSFPNLVLSYDKIHTGFIILQYTKYFTVSHQHIHQLYEFIYTTLQTINNADHRSLQWLTLFFEIKFLRMLGFFHTTTVCESCHQPFQTMIYLAKGQYRCPACAQEKNLIFSVASNASLILMSNHTLEDILQQRFPQNHISAIEKILSHFRTLAFPDQWTLQRYAKFVLG
jgi:DNA repair protein RecO (recombination protein O)